MKNAEKCEKYLALLAEFKNETFLGSFRTLCHCIFEDGTKAGVLCGCSMSGV